MNKVTEDKCARFVKWHITVEALLERTKILESDKPGFKSHCSSYFCGNNWLTLTFLICKKGIIIFNSQGCHGDSLDKKENFCNAWEVLDSLKYIS